MVTSSSFLIGIERTYCELSVAGRFGRDFFHVETYVVLLTELLGERGAHDSAADTGWGREVLLAGLSAGRVEGCKFEVSNVFDLLFLRITIVFAMSDIIIVITYRS